MYYFIRLNPYFLKKQAGAYLFLSLLYDGASQRDLENQELKVSYLKTEEVIW